MPEEKRCARCELHKLSSEFSRDARLRSGLSSWCKDCHRDYMRERKGNPEARRRNAKASAVRHPERRRAREKVKDAIRRGDLPPAKACACVDCGGPAAAYDHRDHAQPLAVEAVCHPCHGKRSRARGEHAKAGRELDGRTWDEVPAP